MQLKTDRRALHQIPELDRDLPETLAYLKSSLAPLNCRVFSPAETGLCAWFDFGRAEALAFRADCDGLPICEQTGAAYASFHPGAMHACGHDGHMAILLELARRLSEKKTYPRNVLLVFQSAEETTGGARDICESGVFEQYNVRAIFGLHLWPGLEAGVMASRCRELMARSCEVTVDIFGKSAHIARAEAGIDALAAGVKFYTEAMTMEQVLPKKFFRLLKFGKFESGTVRNALAAQAHLEGSLRAFQDEVFEGLQEGLRSIRDRVCREFGCTMDLHFSSGYPAVMNPPELYARVRQVMAFRELERPAMTAEDFSWYQRYLPGMFFFLGVGDTPALHGDTFDFDEGVLEKGADFFEELGEKLP
ncbi:MAG: amidohydrolase [Eubacteriales bacterium]|nr:amidohydrolase [Eubacteriales bacterium]